MTRGLRQIRIYSRLCWRVAAAGGSPSARLRNYVVALGLPLACRAGRGVTLVCVAHGRRHRIEVRDIGHLHVVRDVFVSKQYDVALPDEASVVVDLGANIGAASAWLHARYPGCRVIAVEADPENYAVLARNLARLDGAEAIHAAVLDRDGEIEWSRASASWGHGLFADRPSGQTVPVRRLSTILDALGVDTVDLLKIDVEGAEYAVFGDLTAAPPIGCIVGELHPQFFDQPPDLPAPFVDTFDCELIQTPADALVIARRRAGVP